MPLTPEVLPPAQNRARTALAAYQFKPGNLANPGGRPAGIYERVRRAVGKDGRKIVDGLAAIGLGDAAARRKVFGEAGRSPQWKERIAALVALAKLGGWGDAREDSTGGWTINVLVPDAVSDETWQARLPPPSDIETR